jgi:hypothetical protein
MVIAVDNFDHLAICLSKLGDWGHAHSEPVRLIHDNPKKYATTETLLTVGFLLVEPLVESTNGQDYDYSPWFAMKTSSMGCPPPGRCTVMEMWS